LCDNASGDTQDLTFATTGVNNINVITGATFDVDTVADDVTPDAALAFATTGIGFTVYGVPLAQDSALVDTGLDFALGPNTTADVSYQATSAIMSPTTPSKAASPGCSTPAMAKRRRA